MTVTAAIDPAAARRAMIDSQLRTSGINDPSVLAAMAKVPREEHVPAAARGHAYIDRAIPLGAGRALPAPLVQAAMLAQAIPRAGERALVVSAGSTYLAALVEAMGASVEAIDAADAAAGKAQSGGFDVLLIDGAVEILPDALIATLRDGARVVAGLSKGAVTSLAAGHKLGGAVALVARAEMGIPVLHDFAAPKSWSF
jgi:protein-L-isoaspartate(D-aspartate) O-methyltransferase